MMNIITSGIPGWIILKVLKRTWLFGYINRPGQIFIVKSDDIPSFPVYAVLKSPINNMSVRVNLAHSNDIC